MLALSRNFPAYLKNQERHIWRREGQDWLPLYGHTIVILGVGSSAGNRAWCQSRFWNNSSGDVADTARATQTDRSFDKTELLKVLPEEGGPSPRTKRRRFAI